MANQRPNLNIQGLDPDTAAACALFEEYPLDRQAIGADSGTEVQLILAGGFNHFSQMLALAAAQTAHYANGRPPRLVLFDHPDEAEGELRGRFPQAEAAARFVFTGLKLASPAGQERLARDVQKEDRLTTLVFRDEQPPQGLPAWLPPWSGRENILILALAGDVDNHPMREFMKPGEAGFNIRLFRADALDRQALKIDETARILHGYYNARYPGEPNAGPWEKLEPEARRNNYWQALHLSAKLRAVGCRFTPRTEAIAGEEPVTWFNDLEIETLARMEHNRWQANRSLAGYRPGPRDDRRLFHPDLRPYEDLEEDVKDKDRLFIRALPDLAERLGRIIVRREKHESG